MFQLHAFHFLRASNFSDQQPKIVDQKKNGDGRKRQRQDQSITLKPVIPRGQASSEAISHRLPCSWSRPSNRSSWESNSRIAETSFGQSWHCGRLRGRNLLQLREVLPVQRLEVRPVEIAGEDCPRSIAAVPRWRSEFFGQILQKVLTLVRVSGNGVSQRGTADLGQLLVESL